MNCCDPKRGTWSKWDFIVANISIENSPFERSLHVLTLPQSRCSYSILNLKLFNSFLTKSITKRPSETAKLHRENGGQYGYRHKHTNIFKAG